MFTAHRTNCRADEFRAQSTVIPRTSLHLQGFQPYPAFPKKLRSVLGAPVQPSRAITISADLRENAICRRAHKKPEIQLHPVVRIVTVRPAPYSDHALPMGTFAAF
jgi:hypothetical protein